jgi:hypothetical protein
MPAPGKIPNRKIPNPKKIPNFNGRNFKGAAAVPPCGKRDACPTLPAVAFFMHAGGVFMECGDLSPLLTGRFIAPPEEVEGFAPAAAVGAARPVAPSKAATGRRTPKGAAALPPSGKRDACPTLASAGFFEIWDLFILEFFLGFRDLGFTREARQKLPFRLTLQTVPGSQ